MIFAARRSASPPYQLCWQKLDVPSAQTLDVFDHNLEAAEVQGGDGIESNVKEDEGPFEEGVYGVGCRSISAGFSTDHLLCAPPGTR